MKKTLAFIILVVLALAAFNVYSLPHVKAQTTQAQVLSYSWYLAPSTTTTAEYISDLIAVGEVQNTGSNTIGSMWVGGAAYDSNGTLLASTEAQVMATNLPPNQKAPFYLDFTPESSITQDQSWVSSVANVTVSLGSTLNATGTGTQYAGLNAVNLNGVNNAGTYTVSGTIADIGDQSVGDIGVVATFYNANGTVVGLSLTDLGTSLLTGAAIPFKVTPWDNTGTLSSEISSYSILLQSVPLSPTSTPAPTVAPTTQPTSSPSGSPTPTQTSGSAVSIPTYAILIAVVVVIAVIAALILLRRRGGSHKSEAPTSLPSQNPQQ